MAYPIVGVGSKFVHRHQRLAGPSRGVRDGLPSAAHFGLRVAPFDGNVDRVAHVQPAQARRIPFPLQRHRSVANRPGNWNRRRDPPHPSCQDKIVVLLVNGFISQRATSTHCVAIGVEFTTKLFAASFTCGLLDISAQKYNLLKKRQSFASVKILINTYPVSVLRKTIFMTTGIGRNLKK